MSLLSKTNREFLLEDHCLEAMAYRSILDKVAGERGETLTPSDDSFQIAYDRLRAIDRAKQNSTPVSPKAAS